jgi:hypothetical protein
MVFRGKLLGVLGGGAVLLAAAAVFVYANLTGIVRGVLEKQVPGLTFSSLQVGWNKVVVEGVALERGRRTVFKVDALRVYPSMWSVFSDTLHISAIEVDGPYVYLVRNPDGSLTLPVPEGYQSKPNAPGEATGKPLALKIGRVRVRDGKGELLDRSAADARFVLSDLNLEVDELALPQGPGRIPFELRARLDGKRQGQLAARSWYLGATRSAQLEFQLTDLFVPKAEPYFRGKHTTARLEDGALGLKLDLTMAEGAWKAKVALSLEELIFDREGLFLAVPTPVVRKLLQDDKKAFELALTLEGDLADRAKLQHKLVAAVLVELGARTRKKGLESLTGVDGKGAAEAVKGAGKAAERLFGR